MPLHIILPCFNEADSIIRLLQELESVLSQLEDEFVVVVVDDGSTDNTAELLSRFSFGSVNCKLRILTTVVNQGHQSAIRQGLLFAQQENASFVVVMDGDGEDDPSVIKELLHVRDADVVQVRRGKRAESLRFRMLYAIYNFIFMMLIGRRLSVGNFCLIGPRVIELIKYQNFYHLGAFLSRIPVRRKVIVADRRKRIAGTSKMSYRKLFYHAIKSFVEYGEELITLFLKMTIALAFIFFLFLAVIFYLKVFTDKAILGWASTVGAALLACTLICAGFFVSGIVLLRISNQRMNQPQLPTFKIVR